MGNKAFKHSFQQARKLPIKNKRMGNKGFLAFLTGKILIIIRMGNKGFLAVLTTRNEAAY